jgi:glycosyltransferase involved in cell wall biosynthesis
MASQPVQVAIITETYPPEINGVANTMHHLVAGLCQRHYQVTVIRPQQGSDHKRATKYNSWPTQIAPYRSECLVPGLPVPGYQGLHFGLPIIGRLRRYWHHNRPDIVYIATQGPLGWAALFVARRFKIPVLTGFHTQFHQYSEYYGIGILMRPIIHALRWFHNQSSGTLAPTQALCQSLTTMGFKNVTIFSRGVDIQLFSPTRRSDQLRQQWGCDQTTVAVLYVGRIAAEKNIALALQAFEQIKRQQPNSRLIFIGDGPERAQNQARYPEHIFMGARVGVELATGYASADLFLFPSLTETFGNVVLEAMASGLPVLAFQQAAAADLIQCHQNGMTVPAGDQAAYCTVAQQMSIERESLRDWGKAARLTALQHDWDSVIDSIVHQFRCLIKPVAKNCVITHDPLDSKLIQDGTVRPESDD